MKVFIALIENLKDRINQAIPVMIQILVGELNDCIANKAPKNYTSMVLQAIALCFWYNSELMFGVLEQMGSTISVFQSWI